MKLALLSVVAFVNSLYFEITDKDKKCFIEELPDDTQMIGKYLVQIFDRQSKVNPWVVMVRFIKNIFFCSGVERVSAWFWDACRSSWPTQQGRVVTSVWLTREGKNIISSGKAVFWSNLFLVYIHLSSTRRAQDLSHGQFDKLVVVRWEVTSSFGLTGTFSSEQSDCINSKQL